MQGVRVVVPGVGDGDEHELRLELQVYKLDNIYKIAKSQGRLEWYKEMRGSDVSLQMCIAEYTNRTHDRSTRTRAATFQALETVSASTAVIMQEKGKMMSERQYMAFADTFDGGKLSETQAKNQWLVWKEQALEPGSTWPAKDYKGPGEELRLWVKTDDLILFQNKSEWSKSVQGRSKDVKNPNEVDLDKMKKEIHSDHSFASSAQEVAANMALHSGGQAFQQSAMDIGDVTGLVKPVYPEAEQGEDGEEKEKEKVEEPEPPSKRRRWFDYDKQVSKAVTKFKEGQLKFKQDIEYTLQKAKDTLADCKPLQIAGMSQAIQICENRMEPLQYILNNDSPKLQGYIKRFCEGQAAGNSPQKAAGAGESSVTGRAVLGQAPPCASYTDLITLGEVEVYCAEFSDATSDDDIKGINAKVAEARKPLKELVAAVTSQVREVSKIKDNAARAAAKAAAKAKGKGGKNKDKGKGGKAGGGDPKAVSMQMDGIVYLMTSIAPEICREIPPAFGSGMEVDLKGLEHCPAIIRLETVEKALREQPITGIIDNFMQDFDQSVPCLAIQSPQELCQVMFTVFCRGFWIFSRTCAQDMKAKKGRGSQKCPRSNPSVQKVVDLLEGSLKGFCCTAPGAELV